MAAYETRTYDVNGIHVEADIVDSARWVACVAHGLGGRADQRHMLAIRCTLVEAGWTAVAWDARDALGSRSRGGSMTEATLTRYLEDYEAVAAWTRSMPWGTGPRLAGGHSLGGFASLLYTLRHPEEVAGIFPLATVYSGPRWWVAKQSRDMAAFRDWRREWVRYEASRRYPGMSREISWRLAEDYLRYDVLMDADRIAVPVCLAVGTLDEQTPPEEQRVLRDALSHTSVRYAEIDGMPHTPTDETHLSALSAHLRAWLGEYFVSR